jgi:hypothetical protein
MSHELEASQPIQQNYFKKFLFSWALEAHACNSSCSGGRDEKDGVSKPV